MVPTRLSRGPRRALIVATATALVAAFALGPLALTPAGAAGLCATPGGSGAGGTITGVVNTYYPGVGTANAGATAISVGASAGAATLIAAGDMLLVIQMQGADFNATNTNSYGHGGAAVAPASGYTALNNSGVYEYVRATSGVTAGVVNISGLGAGAGLLNTYTTAAATGAAGQRTFQVIRVPQYTTATTSSGLTALAWNGSVGGVLALDTTSTLTLAGTVNVNGLGFRGAAGIQRGGAGGFANTDVVTTATSAVNGNKGEGIGGTPLGTSAGNGYPTGDGARGAPANAGGGGTDGNPSANDQNSGGGGGGNGGAGGIGGNTWSSNLATGGYGGVAIPATAGRVVMGGGAGAGTNNNSAGPTNSSGSNGGGIVVIRAGSIAGAGTISADGIAAYNSTANDGGGGGGAGGSIVLTSPSGSLAGATLTANGGTGGNAWATQAPGTFPGNAHGPGGGGGGGWILTSSAPTAQSVAGGAHGITTTGNLAYGSADGSPGQTSTITPSSVPGVSGGAECADLSIVKTAPASVNAGASLSYSLDVSNAGPATASAVSVTDTLPAGVTFTSASGTGWTCTNSGNVSVTCTRPTLLVGAAPTITVVVTAPAQGGTATNAASVTATTPDQNPANNTSTTNTTVNPLADVSIVKTGPASVSATGNVSYQLTVANAGPSDATSVSVTDTLPSGVTFSSASGTGWACTNTGNVSVTCTRPTLAAAATAPVITVVVTAPGQPTTLNNNASVTSSTPDPNLANNTATSSTNVTGLADLAISKTGPASVVAGNNVSYTLTVNNVGPSDAASLTVGDTLPAGVTFVSATGTGWTCTNAGNVSVTCTRLTLATGATAPAITVVVTAPAQAGVLSNSATVASTTADPTPGNNTSIATTTVTASADLSIAKSGPGSVVAAGSVSYSLTVTNNGPSDAANLTVADTLPAGVTFVSAGGTGWVCSNTGNVSVSCTRAALATGAVAPAITVVVTAPNQATTLSNTASVASTTSDPVPANNTAFASTTVTASADLQMAKLGPPTVTAAGSVSYSLTVTNNGPSDAANLTVTDALPAGVTFSSASGTGWTCSNTGNVSVTCTRPALATGAVAPVITVVVTAPSQATTLSNTASVASTTADPTPGNNTSTVSTGVTASADLSITKSGPGSVVAAGSVSYSLTVTNNGPSDAVNLTVTDILPTGVTFSSASGTGWTCSNTGNVSVTCTRPALATGAVAPVITVVVTAPSQATTLSNTASVASTTADPTPANNTATANTTVTASADLSIAKAGPVSVTAAGTVTYTLTVTNNGPSDAANLTVADTLPAGVTFGSASGAGWTCTNAGNVSVNCTRPALAAGATAAVITVVVTAPSQGGSLTNTASVASTTADPTPGNNTSSTTTTVVASADLAINKSAPATVVAGGSVAYQLTAANNGPSDAANVSVTDILPAGVTFVSASGAGWTCTNNASISVTCTRPALTAGATAPVITVTVTAPVQAGSIANTASVTSTTNDPTPGNNTSSVSTTVTASADLSISKSGPASVQASGSINYTLTVTNNGPSDAATLTVTDTLPAGVTFGSANGTGWTCTNNANISVTCTRVALATGVTAPAITVAVTAPASSGSLTNQAAVSAATPDPVPGNDTSSVTTTVTDLADLAISKLGPPTVTAAGTVTYTVSVTNNGPSPAADATVVDTLPAGVVFQSASGPGWSCTNNANVSVTCTGGALASGATAGSITVSVTAPAQPTSLTNTASVSSTTLDPVPGNNTSSVTTGVTGSADLSMVKTGPASVVASGTVTYSLTVANAGPSDAANVSVVDTLPAGVVFQSASGPGWSCTNNANVSVTCTQPAVPAGSTAPVISVVVTASAQGSVLANSATVTSTTADPAPGNNTATATTTVVPSADLSISKSGPATVVAGAGLSYSLSVTNSGPSDAANLTVTDTLPSGVIFLSASGTGWSCANNANISVTCTTASLSTGTTAPAITVSVTAPSQATTLTNTAAVSSATTDPVPGNNTSSVTTAVTASVDLSISKSGPATVVAGTMVTYALTVTNSGPSDAVNLTVTDSLPAGVTFGSASGAGWACTNNANISVTCTRLALATGATAPAITVGVTAPVQGGSIVNSASVTSATNDPVPGNNTATASTTVTASADLAIAKTGPASVQASGTITYTLTVTNSGPSDAVNLTVTDTLPAGVTFGSASGAGWACTNNANISVTCTSALLATGATASAISVTVTASANAGSVTNTATVSSITPDPDPANNISSVTTAVTPLADLAVTKLGPPTVTAAGVITYTVSVANSGPSTAADATVTDTLPAGVTYSSATGTGWSCTDNGNVSVTCTYGAVAIGALPSITIVVTAPNQPTSLTNSASVSSTTPDPIPANNTASVTTGVTGSADLALVKTGPATVTASGTVTYHLTVSNAGPSDADNVSVVDTLPAGVAFQSASGTGWSCTNNANVSVTCTLSTLAAGASAPVITVDVSAPGQGTVIANSATVTSTTSDPDPTDNTDSASTIVVPSADLAIAKTGPASVSAAGAVSYTLTVTNDGPSDAANLSVSDALPAGVTFGSASGTGWACANSGNVSVTCTSATLAVGATAPDITVVVTAPNQASTLTNTATVSSATNDPIAGNNTSSVDTSVTALADLSIVKSAPATVVAGNAITYTLNVANAGPSDAHNVTVTDTLPAGVVFVSAGGGIWSCSNNANVSVTCTRLTIVSGGAPAAITIQVTAPAQATTVINAATVISATPDPNSGNDASSATTDVTASADLSIVKTGPAAVAAGGTVSYDLTITNNGPSDADTVTVTDTLPANVTFGSVNAPGGWTCGNAGNVSVACTISALATGASAVITVVVTAPNQPTTLDNAATVTSSTFDPDPNNNTDQVSTGVGALADLTLTKTGPASVDPSADLTYQVSVANLGPSDATAVVVTDTLPAGVVFRQATGAGWTCTHVGNVSVTCTRTSVTSGSTAALISIVVTAPGHQVSITNSASVTSASLDADPTNNTDSVTTSVGPSADLSVVKTGPDSVRTGATVTYHLAVTNDGPDAAASVRVRDQLPDGVTFVSADGGGWDCTHDASVSVTCTRSSLANGATAPTITVVILAPATVGDMTNRASVSSVTHDPVADNNSSSVPTVITSSTPGGGDHGTGGGGELPHTGADVGPLLAAGLALLLLGGSLLLVARRRDV